MKLGTHKSQWKIKPRNSFSSTVPTVTRALKQKGKSESKKYINKSLRKQVYQASGSLGNIMRTFIDKRQLKLCLERVNLGPSEQGNHFNGVNVCPNF